jgi:hypothetical protein
MKKYKLKFINNEEPPNKKLNRKFLKKGLFFKPEYQIPSRNIQIPLNEQKYPP